MFKITLLAAVAAIGFTASAHAQLTSEEKAAGKAAMEQIQTQIKAATTCRDLIVAADAFGDLVLKTAIKVGTPEAAKIAALTRRQIMAGDFDAYSQSGKSDIDWKLCANDAEAKMMFQLSDQDRTAIAQAQAASEADLPHAMPEYDVAGFCSNPGNRDFQDERGCLSLQYSMKAMVGLTWTHLSATAQNQCLAADAKFGDYQMLFLCTQPYADKE